jgi:hypothetical protein
MKNVFTPFAALSILAVSAAPALACDMHGGGFGGGAFGMNWQKYSPQASSIDPAFERALAESLGKNEGYTPVRQAVPKKPSFSSVASRASQRALTRRAKAEKTEKPETKTSETPSVKKVSLDSDG